MNEAPKFVGRRRHVPAVLNAVENTRALRVGATGDTDLDGVAYNADDEDATQTQSIFQDSTQRRQRLRQNAALTLSGADAKYFNIEDSGAY